MSFDVLVIGGGPGGYVCAIRSAQLGLKVGIIEEDKMGGVCLNYGCIPTKALLKSTEVINTIKKSSDFGVLVEKFAINLDQIVKKASSASGKLSRGIESLMKKNKIELIKGRAVIKSKNQIVVTGSDGKNTVYGSKYIVIATGASAKSIPICKPNGKTIWTYKDGIFPKKNPEEMIIIGSGAIGTEFATFYNSIGCKVTLIEAAKNILPLEDSDISIIAQKELEKSGVKVVTSAKIESITERDGGVIVDTYIDSKKESYRANVLMLAVGVKPNTENIGLENISITAEPNGSIKIDKFCQTSTDNVYAIGDVASTTPWLAHKASHEGIVSAESIANKMGKTKQKPHPICYSNIPACTFSTPQIASVGLTEESAKKISDIEIKVGKFPGIANGKSVATGDENSLVKVIFNKNTGEILGVNMIGSGVSEMIQGLAIAKQAELTEDDLMQTIFPHPTMSEMIHEAVLSAFDRAIHI